MITTEYQQTKMCFSCREWFPIYQVAYISDHYYLCRNCLEKNISSIDNSDLAKRRVKSNAICPHCSDIFTCFDAPCVGFAQCESCWNYVYQVYEIDGGRMIFKDREDAIDKIGQQGIDKVDRRNNASFRKWMCPHCNDKLTFLELREVVGLVHCETCSNSVYMVSPYNSETRLFKNYGEAVAMFGKAMIESMKKDGW